VDWEFIARRNTQAPENWRVEDRRRHKRAMERLDETGYLVVPRTPRAQSET
jgi:hypothetical protein